MTNVWEAAIAHVLWWETGGDLVNGAPHSDPDDPGGLTKWGISQRAWPDEDILSLTRQQAERIYYDHYWSSPSIHLIPGSLAVQVFDHGVTSGPRRAVMILQGVIGVSVDGVIGNKTIAACGKPDAARLYLIARLNYYRNLNRPKYLNGWTNRAATCALVAGKF